jgi:hypothetical protein
MLFICLWAVFLFYVDKGMVSEGALPPYLLPENSLSQEYIPTQEEITEDIEILSEDSLARLAPIWDSILSGEDVSVDSVTIAKYFSNIKQADVKAKDEKESEHEQLRHNVGLAHTHINGQTLLFFALGFVFLFTSIKPKMKKILLIIFGTAILMHAIGLSGEGFHWFYDDILALSGLTLLVIIPYICFLIFVDLLRKPYVGQY